MASLRTPLYDWHVRHKARIVEFGGWDMPVQYSTIIEEHTAVRTKAGLFDISHMGRLSFSGKNALDLIQKVWTNDAAKMKDFQVRYGLICNEKGGVLDDVLVYRWPWGWSMIVNASNREKILLWLLKHVRLAGDLVLDDVTMPTALLAVQGPKAVEICQGMFADDPSVLKYYHAMPTKYNGVTCIVSRTGYTGEDGYEIGVDAGLAETLADDLVKRGALPCGLGARDTLRLEAAMPLYGHELTEAIDPYQAGLDWAVKLEKGDFIGRERLAETADLDAPKRVGLLLEGKRAAREGCHVLKHHSEVGKVTSGSFAPTLQKSIAMAYVSPRFTPVGTELTIDIRGDLTPAKVVKLPFYKRK